MKEKDIQELFAYIKKRLPNCKTVPKLTKHLAAEWCRNFDGYTVAQMMQAVEKQAFLKSFWPDPEELMAHLPPLPKAWPWKGWPAYGYCDVDDYKAQLLAFIERSRREDKLLEAHGL